MWIGGKWTPGTRRTIYHQMSQQISPKCFCLSLLTERVLTLNRWLRRDAYWGHHQILVDKHFLRKMRTESMLVLRAFSCWKIERKIIQAYFWNHLDFKCLLELLCLSIERKQKWMQRQIFVQRHVIKTINQNRQINMFVATTGSNKSHNFRARRNTMWRRWIDRTGRDSVSSCAKHSDNWTRARKIELSVEATLTQAHRRVTHRSVVPKRKQNFN